MDLFMTFATPTAEQSYRQKDKVMKPVIHNYDNKNDNKTKKKLKYLIIVRVKNIL